MSSIPDAKDMIKLFKNPEQQKLVRFATIDSAYTSGRPSLIFDGEDTATLKKYPYISTYTPTAGDRVMLIKNVIMGAIV